MGRDGWKEVPLEKCVDILDSKRVPLNSEERQSIKGEIPYYGATGIVDRINKYLFDEELLLLGEDGAPFLDKSKNICYLITGKSWVNNHAHVLRANSKTTNSYLMHYLNQFDFHEYINGTTRHKLTQSKMKTIPIPLPPLDEQKRITARLDAILPRVKKVRERLARIRLILKRFRQSVLAAACSGKLTEPFDSAQGREWREGKGLPEWEDKRPLHDCIESMLNGIYKKEKYYSQDGIACLRMYNISEGKIELVNLKRMDLTDSELKKYSLNAGDILINRVNSKELVGKAAVIKTEDLKEPLIFESKNIRVRLKSQISNPLYINYCLSIEKDKGNLGIASKQTAGMATISQPQIAQIEVFFPSLEEQNRIVEEVEKYIELLHIMEAVYQKAFERVKKIEQAILARAFRGELVEEAINDLPAG